jgi:CRISPR type II-A-associated protein Csn2
MQLFYKPLDILFDFDKHDVIEFVIEDKDYFTKALFDLYEAFENTEGSWICSKNDCIQTFDKNVYAVNDFYFMPNPSKSRTVTTALLKQITVLAESPEHIEQCQELVASVERYGLSLVEELGYDFEISIEEGFGVTSLIKAMGYKIYLNSDDLVARTIEFCDVLNTLIGINMFILVNVSQLMGASNVQSLVKELQYHGYKALLLGSSPCDSAVPTRIIVDENLVVL